MNSRHLWLAILMFLFLTVPAVALAGTWTLQSEPAPDVVTDPGQSSNIVASRRLLEVVRAGGPLMIPIGISSVVLLVFVFERAVSLRKRRIIPKPFVSRFFEQLRDGALDRESAIDVCEEDGSPVAFVFTSGLRKWGKPSVEVEQAVLDAGERVSNEMRKYLRLINGIATVCPLLGLLGTVLGMIQAFDSISAVDPSLGDPKQLIAAGISQALLTTAAGMSVAIPAIIAYLYFTGRVDQRVIEIDALGQQLVCEISAESLEEASSGKSKRSRSRSKSAA